MTLEEIDARLAQGPAPAERIALEKERARLRGSRYHRGQLVHIRVYNYPWSGRMGRINTSCLICGASGPLFQLSSSNRCLKCPHDATPDPERLVAFQAQMDAAVDQWCKDNQVDRKATEARLRAAYGEPNQYMRVIRDDLDIAEALAGFGQSEARDWPSKRGFPPHYVESWLRYGQIAGQPDLNPFTDGPPFQPPGE